MSQTMLPLDYPMAMYPGDHWVLQDANYNVLGLVARDGKMVERYEYSPYGERKVFVSAGANDPGCYAPTLVSGRRTMYTWTGQWNSVPVSVPDQPFGLSEFGHQGLPHEEELDNGRLIQNRHRVLHVGLGRFIQRDPIGYVDGMSLYQYVRSSPIKKLDPWGLDTYLQNRQLAALASPGGPNATRAPITHTFVYTTNPDGSLKHTYSWGNTYDANGNGEWHQDHPHDLRAAQQAIADRQRDEAGQKWWFEEDVYGPHVGDQTLDEHIENAYQNRQNDPNHPSRHPNGVISDNCKTEARNLVDDAKKRQKETGEGYRS